MALGDITIYDDGPFGYPPEESYSVNLGTTTSILAGEPVSHPLASTSVVAVLGSTPTTSSEYWAGIAATSSNETTTARGIVSVTRLFPGVTYLCQPSVATSWDTQAEYDDLVGKRVLLEKASGTFKVLASDSANNGLVVEPLDISKYPGRVRFSIRNAINFLS